MDLDGSSSDFSFHDTGFSVALARIHQCCIKGCPGQEVIRSMVIGSLGYM